MATPTTKDTISNSHPYIFNEFITSGFEETASPFLTPSSRTLGKNLKLKAAFLATLFLLSSFYLSFFPTLLPLSNLSLVFVFFLAGIPPLIDAIKDITNLEINIDVLMTLAAFLSIVIGNNMEGGLLLVLFALSGAIENTVSSKARGTLNYLNSLAPSKANILLEGRKIIERSIKDIKVGTKILVRSGEVVPLDGEIIHGASFVNLVHLTGETVPIPKKIHDFVPAGANNLEGAFTLKVQKTSAESTLNRIIELITQAQQARPKLQRWLDKVSDTYSISIILFTLFLACSLPLFIDIPYIGNNGSIYRSLTFLVAASPCALIIAIPIAYLSAISACARQGILLKGGAILDALASCSTIAFDKTGTLTTGDLTCISIDPIEDWKSEDEKRQVLAIALTLEQSTIHPISKAITAYANENNISPLNLEEFRSIPGNGLEGVVKLKGETIKASIGHLDFIRSKIDPKSQNKLNSRIKEVHNTNEGLSILLVDKRLFLFRFLDTIREKMPETLDSLSKQKNMHCLILSGDHRESVKATAHKLGIQSYYAELKPEDKLRYVEKFSEEKGLIMVGDGINDAPALARATAGISMGKLGHTTTIDISDVILLHNNLETLPWLIHKAHTTQEIVKQNVVIAASTIIFAGATAFLGMIPLWLAVVMHEGGTIIVGLNSLRLLKK